MEAPKWCKGSHSVSPLRCVVLVPQCMYVTTRAAATAKAELLQCWSPLCQPHSGDCFISDENVTRQSGEVVTQNDIYIYCI